MIWLILWEKLQTRLCLKRRYCRGNWQHKSEKRYRHLFRHTTHVAFFKVTLQQNINMMCKIRENDGCLCCVKMLNFGSKTLKMLEFIPWIDLLLSDIQHRVFRKNALFKFGFDEFTWPQHYGTPKFWPKISHSGKCVEILLTKVNMPHTSTLSRTSSRIRMIITIAV